MYQNLNKGMYLNALSLEDISKLWLPLVIYTNTDQKETTRLGAEWEWTTDVWVKREGNFVRGDLDVLDEVEIFKGEENSLVMTQSYTHEFQCVYELERYPFDTQASTSKKQKSNETFLRCARSRWTLKQETRTRSRYCLPASPSSSPKT